MWIDDFGWSLRRRARQKLIVSSSRHPPSLSIIRRRLGREMGKLSNCISGRSRSCLFRFAWLSLRMQRSIYISKGFCYHLRISSRKDADSSWFKADWKTDCDRSSGRIETIFGVVGLIVCSSRDSCCTAFDSVVSSLSSSSDKTRTASFCISSFVLFFIGNKTIMGGVLTLVNLQWRLCGVFSFLNRGLACWRQKGVWGQSIW